MFMKKVILCTVMLLVLGMLFASVTHAQTDVAANLIIENHSIEIITTNEAFQVVEEITLENTANTSYNDSLNIWVQHNFENLKIYPKDTKTKSIAYDQLNNIYQYNLSAFNLSIASNTSFVLVIEYKLPKNVSSIQEKQLYNTKRLILEQDDIVIYESINVTTNSFVTITLAAYQEPPVSSIIYLVYIAIIAVIVGAAFFTSKHLKVKKIEKRSETETTELLATQKKLLLNFLKELEKEHRSQKISDHTYNKLKEEYKHQAVAVMKMLDKKDTSEDT